MDDETLIVLVEENSVLYDLKHPKYINTQFKERIWKNIGEQLKHKVIVHIFIYFHQICIKQFYFPREWNLRENSIIF